MDKIKIVLTNKMILDSHAYLFDYKIVVINQASQTIINGLIICTEIHENVPYNFERVNFYAKAKRRQAQGAKIEFQY